MKADAVSLREELHDRLTPFLDPEEVIQHVFLARREVGWTIFSLGPLPILYRLLTRNLVLGAVTDHNIILMNCWRWGAPRHVLWRWISSRRVVSRISLEKGLDLMRGGTAIFVGMSCYVIDPHFREDVAVADRQLGGSRDEK